MNQIFNSYFIRHTQKQKHTFLEYAINQFQQYGYKTQIQDVVTFGIPNYNLIIGDIDKADVIFTAHYDTPNTILSGVKMYPYSFIKSLLGQLRSVAISLVLWVIIGYFNYSVGYIVFMLVAILTCLFFTNKNNYNDNTSGVLTIYNLARELAGQNNVAFILFDNEEKGLLGSIGFAEKYRKVAKNKLFINFDCVGDGNNILIGAKKKNIHLAEQISNLSTSTTKSVKPYIKKNPLLLSDDANFKNAIQVMAFKGEGKKLYLDKIHTNRDTKLDESNIDCIVDMMKKFVMQNNNL